MNENPVAIVDKPTKKNESGLLITKNPYTENPYTESLQEKIVDNSKNKDESASLITKNPYTKNPYTENPNAVNPTTINSQENLNKSTIILPAHAGVILFPANTAKIFIDQIRDRKYNDVEENCRNCHNNSMRQEGIGLWKSKEMHIFNSL